MLFTCLMPTYGRVSSDLACIQEAVYWFSVQRGLPNGVTAELLILNDAPQTLVCDVHGVRVINMNARAGSLGAKYNIGVQAAAGLYILPWEDDDISLPHRIAQAAEAVMRTQCDYWNPGASFYEESSRLQINHKQGVNHNASCYKRSFAIEHPYPETNAQDAGFDRTARMFGRCVVGGLVKAPELWSYVYRWGHTFDGHLSGHPAVDAAYRDWKRPQPGTYRIEPRMHRDYVADCEALTKKPK
jgi:hypothetical protein